MTFSHRILLLAVGGHLLLTGSAFPHPLDPPSRDEISRVVPILQEAGRIDASSRFALVTLFRPPKAEVLAWREGDPHSRQLLAVVKKGEQTFEAVVDIRAGQVSSWQEIRDVQPMLLDEELFAVGELVQGDPRWIEAMRKRGYSSFETIICMPLSAGYLGDTTEIGRRLVRVPCFEGGAGRNFWAHPIEGVTAVVDLNRRSVFQVHDTGVVPVPQTAAEYGREDAGPLRTVSPLTITQPGGAGYRMQGQEVSWQGWQFHFRFDARVGPVLSLLRYQSSDAIRSILYEAHLSEIFVPYMDPDIGWSFRTYMDAGEYGAGKLMSPLQAGRDCPPFSTFLPAVIADDSGQPVERPGAACLFERDPLNPAWRHHDLFGGTTESRGSQELVLRFIPAIGNYDYVFDWIFRQDGSIQVRVGATGIVEVKGVAPVDAGADREGTADRYGRFIDRNTVAVNHDHFINFRLDFDVDGTQNSFTIDRLQRREVDGGGGRKSLWTVESSLARREEEARMVLNPQHPALWRVTNPGVTGPGGYPVSFQLAPGHNAVTLLDPSDWPQLRAGFTQYHIWVTPYRAGERYAGGDYPYQSRKAEGLSEWTRANRPIENTDIVVWYTLGFHHVVRAEDWPVMPTAWHEFEIRPFGFHRRNPAMNVP